MPATRDDQIADLITNVALDADTPRPAWIDDQEWDAVTRLAPIERELRNGAAAVPPLHQDKTAVMLGLVPDPAVRLDPKAFKKARQSARLDIKQVTEQLATRGWDVSTNDVFGWETRGAADVPPAVIEALAAITGRPTEALTAAGHGQQAGPQTSQRTELAADDPYVRHLTDRLAAALRIDPMAAFARLNRMSTAAVYRGDQPHDDELFHRLDQYISVLEGRHDS